ncbi:uncharacterized protein LOC123868950 isoform X2 [Maniola jurtina]|uniref:uncharacterized protein LOC123868950 isoform X2 n=1 Tax=Maniola jurtina TaxID=191418 RepID=UPI001E68C92F|nr:uncharacterized protein LOC123868950 isoform X2 [Maniola jurtina]
MLKATVKARDDIDVKDYTKLVNFIKRASRGFKSKKANVLSSEHVQKFLDEAPDIIYLVTKVALIFGITGACGRRELADITTKDIEEYGEMFLVRITNKKKKTLRTFTIHGQFYKIVKKYEVLRTSRAKHDRFFQNYQKGLASSSLRIYIENLSDTLKNLPPKSREKYVIAYENFISWKNRKCLESFSEDVFLAYFEELAEKYKPSTLWCLYSMLKATVKARDDIDVKDYTKLVNFIKRASRGFKSKKANVLSSEHVQKFLDEAPDIIYLVTKVALIFGITGACGRRELADITTKDIEEYGEMFLVRITNKKKKTLRTFTIHGQFYKIVKKYEVLRTSRAKHDRFFQNYQKGKCTCQPIGVNKLGAMPREIATYLGLPDAESYTGHSFRKTSSTLMTDDKGTQLLYNN